MMTPVQYSKTTPSEPATTQSVPSVTQDQPANTQCKQTGAVDKPLPSQVPTPEKKTCFESTDTHKATTAGDSLSSCNLVPRDDDDVAAGLKSKLLQSSEDFLLYDDSLDEEMSSCDLDSSLEGKLLIDESPSDEESVDKDDGTKDEEILKCETPSVPLLHKPTSSSSSPITDKEINHRKGTNVDSGTEPPDLCRQEIRNDEPRTISSTNTENGKANEEVDESEGSDPKEMDKSRSESLDVSSKDAFATVKDSSSTDTKVCGETEEIFANKDIKKRLDSKEEELRALIRQAKLNPINSQKYFHESNNVVLKETKNNLTDTITAETPLKEVLNKDHSKDLITEQIFAKEHSTQSILKPSDTEFSASKSVPRTVSPDSTTSTAEESCRLSFVLVEDSFVCLSCYKRFKNESLFKRHVWYHLHNCISSKQSLCKPCLSNQDSSQCPAVKKIFTMLQNSCSKDISSLHVKLLLNTSPPNDKNEESSNQTILAENLLTNSSNHLSKSLCMQPAESRSSQLISSFLRKGQSQNLECLTVCILSQHFLCTKCYKRIDTAKLPQHIYYHLHVSSLPEHGPCVNENECDIMGKIVPVMSSLDIGKDDFFILDISWKWTAQRDLRYRVLLIRHYPNDGPSSNNNPFVSIRQRLQVVRSSNFLIPNPTKENSLPNENRVNGNDNDIEIIECKQITDDNVIVLDSPLGEKVAPSLVQTKEGYKKMTFVIRPGNYICMACRKIYANLDLLKSHIMWHFHSHEKVCSLDHYDGLPLQGRECPILSNIESCIHELDREMKMLIVYWKKDTNGKTYFRVQIVLPKENPVIDLSHHYSEDDEDKSMSNQGGRDTLREETVIVIDDNSLDSNTGQNEEVSLCRESRKTLENNEKENKTNLLTERNVVLKTDPEKIPESEIKDINFSANHVRTSQCVEKTSPNSEGGFYVCGFFSCRFSSIESEHFFDHLKMSHCHEKLFPCIHCHHRASSEELLLKHLNSHANQTLFLLYHCSMCEYATNMLSDFEKHLYSNHGESNSFLCRYCKQSFPSIGLLIGHLKKNLLKFIMCPSCSARDIHRRRMLKHIAACHPNTPRQIVVSCQIICKIISQNRLIDQETRVRDVRAVMQKPKIDSVCFDEEGEGNYMKVRETVIKSKESTHKEAESTNNYSPHNNLESIPTQSVYRGLTNGQNTEMSTQSKIIDDTVNKSNAVECSSNKREIQTKKAEEKQSSLLVKLLSNNDAGMQGSIDILSKLDQRAQKSRSSSEEKGVNDEKGNKVTKEHYTIKENYKLQYELKIMLRRTDWPNDMSGLKNMSSDQASGSGKERNLFQLFGDMEKNPDVHGSQSPRVEAPVLIRESQPVPDVNRDDGVNNDSSYTEECSVEKIQAPSLLQEISLGGSTLDLHLQKCYTYSSPQSQSKQFNCIICHSTSKTLYRMHLHLLSDHFKWPLWECQDCGVRVYSHSKITTHCWRIHKNQSPRIKSLDLPVIELDKDNEFVVVNTQQEFVGSLKPPQLTEIVKKTSTTSVHSKSKKNKSTTDLSVSSAEDPQRLTKSSRKRAKSASSNKSHGKKKRSSSSKVVLEDTRSLVEPTSDEHCVSSVDGQIGAEQPPKKKSKTSSNIERKEKKCSVCDFTCSLKKELSFVQHMIEEHMKKYQHRISDREIELVEEAIAGNPLDGFSCPFCNHNTKQRVDCKIHIWRAHARLKLLDCSRCKFVTWFEHHLKRHVAKTHGNEQESASSKDKETPRGGGGAGSRGGGCGSNTNRPLLTSSKALSTFKSPVQQKQSPGATLGPSKPSLCNECEHVTLFELKDHLKKEPLKKMVNGASKADGTKTVPQKPLPKTKSSLNSPKKQKVLKPSNSSDKLPLKSKNPKTSSVSIPLQKVSPSGKGGNGSKEKIPSEKQTDNNKNSKEKPAPKKTSAEVKKIPTMLKSFLPKPPFPLEKGLGSKSSKTNTGSSGTPAVESKSAGVKRPSSTIKYVETKCVKTGQKRYICPVCSAVKKNISDMKNHWKKYQDTIYRCSQCTYKRHRSDHVLHHIKKEHQNKGDVRSFQMGNGQNAKSKFEK